MAAKGMQFSWRWTSGTISTNLDVIWGMSDKPPAQAQESPRLRVLLGAAIAIGPGKADLLDAIAASGSISAAAKRMGMSYRRAWLLVDTMNRCFREPVLAAAPGGKGGGGATVTPFGEDVLARYDRMQRTAEDSVRDDIAEFAELLADAPPGNDGAADGDGDGAR